MNKFIKVLNDVHEFIVGGTEKQPVKKAEPKKEVKVPTVWITDVQFAKAIICTDPEKVKNVIDQLKLRPEQEEELQEVYNNLMLKSNQ